MIFSMWEIESRCWIPQLCGILPKPISFSLYPEYRIVNYTTWGWTVMLGEQQLRLGMEHIKGTHILLTALGTLSGNYSGATEVVSRTDHFSWPMGTTKLCAAHSDTPIPSDCLLVHASEGKNGQNEPLQMASEHA